MFQKIGLRFIGGRFDSEEPRQHQFLANYSPDDRLKEKTQWLVWWFPITSFKITLHDKIIFSLNNIKNWDFVLLFFCHAIYWHLSWNQTTTAKITNYLCNVTYCKGYCGFSCHLVITLSNLKIVLIIVLRCHFLSKDIHVLTTNILFLTRFNKFTSIHWMKLCVSNQIVC